MHAAAICQILLLSLLVASTAPLESSKADRQTPASQRAAFIQAGLVPDVLSSFDPKFVLDVTYTVPGTGELKAVDPPGRNFTVQQTLNMPTLSIPNAGGELINRTFVVVMVDPDGPTPQAPTASQVRHLLGGGFQLRNQSAGIGAILVNSTPALTEYIHPQPPNYSDPHRYPWWIYDQPADFPSTISSNFLNFNMSAFAEQFGLGPPLAGNYMTVSTKPADLAASGVGLGEERGKYEC